MSHPVVKLSLLALFALVPLAAAPQTTGRVAQQGENSSNSIPLKATSNVRECINLEAVLLARKQAEMLFDGFVAANYAVVKTTVSNHCDDRQFILHDIYFDYSHWALSGVYPGLFAPSCPPAATGSGQNPPSGTQTKTGTDTTGANAGDAGKNTGGAGSNVASAGAPAPATNQNPDCVVDDGTAHSSPGQVATVGALDVQDQDTEDAVFSPRNEAVKAITLIGQVASGYAFIWGGDAAKGIGAYNSAFVENVNKLWPDRRIDQEKNILSLGYRTDRSTAIAKDEHGSYYAFFPLEVFLSPSLTRLFLASPAIFLNPAEVLFEQQLDVKPEGRKTRKEIEKVHPLMELLLSLADQIDEQTRNRFKVESPVLPDQNTKIAHLLVDLASPCPGDSCPYALTTQSDDAGRQSSYNYSRIIAEKFLFQRASLNAVRIAVRGVMTVSVDSVPPTIDSVAFENEKDASLWTVTGAAPSCGDSGAGKGDHAAAAATDTADAAAQPAGQPAAQPAAQSAAQPDKAQTDKAATDKTANDKTGSDKATSEKKGPAQKGKTLNGTISGKFLAGGTASVVAFSIPDKPEAQQKCYIGTVEGDALKSSDASLPFTLQLLGTLPNGSKISFQVSHKVPLSGDEAEGSSTGASKEVNSNKYVYTVAVEATKPPTATAAPHIDDITMENDTKVDVWQKTGTLPGGIEGSNLADGTVKVADLEIADKTADAKTYIGDIRTKSSSAAKLAFELQLLKEIPDGSKLTFTVEIKPDGGAAQTSNAFKYPVKKPAASKPTTGKAHKPAAKAAPNPPQ